ncbi:hypothetical protein Tco_0628984 [Tanacetum coccineum]|uniref:Uncharacterized protein n=1 Tax=Tanacetum coccineum TaxID=301880 RepID=A0ABQ4WRT7_9ASTR
MMLPENQSGSPNSVLDSKMLENSSNDSHEELYLNDEEDDGDSIVVPQTPSKEIRTKIDNTRVPPPLIRGIGEDKILDKIGNPLSLNHIEHGYSIYCENTIEMINSIKDIIEENMDMFSSINEAIKLMLAVVTNMICVIENDIGNEGSKDNLKKESSIGQSWTINITSRNHVVMERRASKQQENIIHFYTILDKHGMLPRSALFRVKEEDSITDVENAVLDLGVVNPLCQSLYVLRPSRPCVLTQLADDMPSRTLTCMEYTRWVFCKLCKSTKEHRAYLNKSTVLPIVFKNSLQAPIRNLDLLIVCGWYAVGSRCVPNRAKRAFKNLTTTLASLVGSASLRPFGKCNQRPTRMYLFAFKMMGMALKSMPQNEFQFLNQLMGIFVDSGPKESRIEDFSCCVVSTVMSTGGTIVASHEDVMGFFAKNTT